VSGRGWVFRVSGAGDYYLLRVCVGGWGGGGDARASGSGRRMWRREGAGAMVLTWCARLLEHAAHHLNRLVLDFLNELLVVKRKGCKIQCDEKLRGAFDV